LSREKCFIIFTFYRLQPTSNLWNGSARLRKHLSRFVSKVFCRVITVLFLFLPLNCFFSQKTHTQVTVPTLLMVAVVALMAPLWAQVSIPCRLYRVHIRPRQILVMQCLHPNTCHRMTNCSQRTGECLQENFAEEIKLFILREPFS
jgi:hypothetical protein